MNPWDAATTIDDARAQVLGTDEPWDDATTRHVDAICGGLKPAPAGELLDFGCGIGRLTAPVARRTGRVVIGVDTSETMLDHARAERADRTVYRSTVPSRPGRFAGVYSMLTFQHMSDVAVQETLDRLGTSLVPGGMVVVQFAIGTTREALCWERDADTIRTWLIGAGLYVLDEWADPVIPVWCWWKARRP